MAYQVMDCPATFDFELSDGSVHSMPVPAAMTVDESIALQAELDAVAGKPIEIASVYESLIRKHCPELDGVSLSTYAVMQISAAWLKASPTSGES